jgi:hypothetical protein
MRTLDYPSRIDSGERRKKALRLRLHHPTANTLPNESKKPKILKYSLSWPKSDLAKYWSKSVSHIYFATDLDAAVETFYNYEPPPVESFSTIFTQLCTLWKEETSFSSSLTEICSNMNYLKIIGIGFPAIPLILDDLAKTFAPWFIALEAISRENPVPPEIEGNFEEMAKLWLLWGQSKKII